MDNASGSGEKKTEYGESLIKPSSAKAKGRRFQQAIVKDILEMYPALEPDDVKSTGMGQPGADVQLSPAAKRLFPYQVECKSKAKSPTHTIYHQALTHGDTEPLVLIKMDRDITLAVVSWEHLKTLIKKEQKDAN